MPGVAPNGPRYRFGPFELNTGEESLSRNGIRVKVQDLPYRLLVMLLERPGEIVTREEVRQRLWPENTFVEFDNSLGVAIRKVRDALNDDAEAPRYVETVPRRGYRFLAPVNVIEGEKPKQTSSSAEAISSVARPRTCGLAFQHSQDWSRRRRHLCDSGTGNLCSSAAKRENAKG